jgi:hypothetical protein
VPPTHDRWALGRQAWEKDVAILALQYYQRFHRMVMTIKLEQLEHRRVAYTCQGNIYICASADNYVRYVLYWRSNVEYLGQ